MPTLLQINTSIGRGSTGKIAEQIAHFASQAGWQCYMAHGARFVGESAMTSWQVSGKATEWGHYLQSRLLDRHGLGSVAATKQLLEKIEALKPDVVHLHNIHGYFVNYPLLLGYLAGKKIPTVVTLHDFWLMTGHCGCLDAECGKWKTGCGHCPRLKEYPAALLDRSEKNWALKKQLFSEFDKDKLVFVPVSHWEEERARQSFLADCRFEVICNGVKTAVFRPFEGEHSALYNKIDWGKHSIITVADRWTRASGFYDMLQLSRSLPEDMQIVMVGLSEKQLRGLPKQIVGVAHTDNLLQLTELYSASDALFNALPSLTFGLVTAEAMACGTPAIVFKGTSGEEITGPNGGFAISQPGEIPALVYECRRRRAEFRSACRERIVKYFDADRQYAKYIDLYNSLLG